MKIIRYTVKDENGIHARPAGVIVNQSKKFKSSIIAKCKDKTADCKKLFSVMALGALSGDLLTIEITGDDECEAEEKIIESLSEAQL